MAQFQSQAPEGNAVAQLEILVRAAVVKPANALVGWLLQQAADRMDAAYQPKPGEVRKGREAIGAQGIFGPFPLARDYYYHVGKGQGHYPADDALGLEVSYTPALAKLICLEGADEPTYLKAQRHLEKTGGIPVSARQIQRVVQRVGAAAQSWQEREAQPTPCDAPILYASGDGTGVPMMPEELQGRKGKQADGTAKTRQVYPVLNPSPNSARCCVKKRSGAGWAARAKWCCSWTARPDWKTWARTVFKTPCRLLISTMAWNTPRLCWPR